jgi:hypothetical protein
MAGGGAAVNVQIKYKTCRLLSLGEGPPKKKKKRTRAKKAIPKNNRPTSPPFFFRCSLRRVWTYHRMWAPAAGCGVFLCELVPSNDTFMSLKKKNADIFFPNGHLFIPSEKQIKFVTSTTTAAVQSKSNSHVNVYYQPVEFTSFCLVCSCSLFCF